MSSEQEQRKQKTKSSLEHDISVLKDEYAKWKQEIAAITKTWLLKILETHDLHDNDPDKFRLPPLNEWLEAMDLLDKQMLEEIQISEENLKKL